MNVHALESTGSTTITKTPDERKSVLANTVGGRVARGARIESHSDY